jgi:glycosylphosphatidylinositol transamidase (GPIT) subunit GPI8
LILGWLHQIFNSKSHELNLYGDTIEVDYRGPEVTVESFLRLLLGRHDDEASCSSPPTLPPAP